jgi:Holliday junction resolvase-like predicted endonuclease
MLQTFGTDQNPHYKGMFSFWKGRKANSQLICSTDIMIQATQERIDMMSDEAWKHKYPSGRIGEAGVMDYNHAMRLATGKSVEHIREKLKEYTTKYTAKNWRTNIGNIDIRHGDNFTSTRRGTKRCYSIPYWGAMEDILT